MIFENVGKSGCQDNQVWELASDIFVGSFQNLVNYQIWISYFLNSPCNSKVASAKEALTCSPVTTSHP
jgi:hypothetical protein